MNPENALFLIDVLTNEVRRMGLTIESQAKAIKELQEKLEAKPQEKAP